VEVNAVQGALGEQGGERVGVGGAAVQVVREDDRDAGLGGGADGDPAEVLAGDVVAQFQAELVAVEGQCEIGIMDQDEAGGKSESNCSGRSGSAGAGAVDVSRVQGFCRELCNCGGCRQGCETAQLCRA
jgi:hypothetical protein